MAEETRMQDYMLTVSAGDDNSPGNSLTNYSFADPRCYPDNTSTPTYTKPTDTFTHLTYGYIIPLMCVCGLVGNVLNLAVLTMQRFHATMYLYLRWMAVADILAMLFWMPQVVSLGWDSEVGKRTVHAARYFTHVGFPLINIFTSSSTMLVVGVTLERYMSVCHPLTIKFRQTVGRAGLFIATCFVLPALLDLPVMLGKYVVLVDCSGAVGFEDRFVFDTEKASYKRTDGYKIGYNWLRVTIVILIPLAIITVLNAITLYTFRNRANYFLVKQKSKKKKHSKGGNSIPNGDSKMLKAPQQTAIRRSTTAGAAAQQEKEETRLTTLLCAIIVLFMITMFPYGIFQILHYTVYRHEQPPSYVIIRNVTNLLMVLNSSCHFYLYCLAGKYFRRYFLVRFGCLSESSLLTGSGGGASVATTKTTRCVSESPRGNGGARAAGVGLVRGTSPRSSSGSISVPVQLALLRDSSDTL